MTSIRFNPELRLEINQSEVSWMQERGHKLKVTAIEAPPIGGKLNSLVDPDFADYLVEKGFQIEVD